MQVCVEKQKTCRYHKQKSLQTHTQTQTLIETRKHRHWPRPSQSKHTPTHSSTHRHTHTLQQHDKPRTCRMILRTFISVLVQKFWTTKLTCVYWHERSYDRIITTTARAARIKLRNKDFYENSRVRDWEMMSSPKTLRVGWYLFLKIPRESSRIVLKSQNTLEIHKKLLRISRCPKKSSIINNPVLSHIFRIRTKNRLEKNPI